ncbi:MAG TPA: hypothetical protein PLJ00_09130 [Chitinophagales bacterium]|nr:hypothetical protein [Chitinophagales bacterium]HRG86286.1 hypothetical protein [Chitinophagales bacterium]
MMHRYSFLILIIIFFVASCVKPPDYPIEPRIEFVSMNANTFDELDEDSLSVVIYFEDGDGDLGSDDSVNMYWEDSRVPGYQVPFKIPMIAIQGNSKAISGTITTFYPISFCINDDDPIDSFYYKIFIVDRAGHESNVDSTDMIFLNCN